MQRRKGLQSQASDLESSTLIELRTDREATRQELERLARAAVEAVEASLETSC